MAQLPQEVEGLVVRKQSTSFLQLVVLHSESGDNGPLFLTNLATINILDELSRTPGIGLASLFSLQNYSMRIWLDTERLVRLNLSPSDVIRAIQAQNVQVSVGRIGAEPIPGDQRLQMNLQTQGRLVTTAQFGNIVIRANPDGSVLRDRDVARIEIGAQSQDTFSRLNGRPLAAIGIFQTPSANGDDRRYSDSGRPGKGEQALPQRREGRRDLKHHRFRARHDPGGGQRRTVAGSCS